MRYTTQGEGTAEPRGEEVKMGCKRGTIRFVPAPAGPAMNRARCIKDGHGNDQDGTLFRPVRNNRTDELEQPLNTREWVANKVSPVPVSLLSLHTRTQKMKMLRRTKVI